MELNLKKTTRIQLLKKKQKILALFPYLRKTFIGESAR